MKIAIHQPNFIPWFPFFEKMEQSDIFVILTECQFEKNSFTNRAKVFDKWWTKPVTAGLIPIMDKRYVDGQLLLDVNIAWISAIAKTLSINAGKIKFDFPTDKTGTERIVEICKYYKADEYLANDKTNYLDKGLLEQNGIKLIPFKNTNKMSVFEMFDKFGIEKTTNILKNYAKREKIDKASAPGSKERSPKTGNTAVAASAAK